ncbi:MAG: hypothetical protein ACOYM0_03305 [Bacteroidales bacterium]
MKKYQLSILLSFFISALFLGLNTSAQVANSKTTGINFQDLPGKWKTINITADNVFQKKPKQSSPGGTTKNNEAVRQTTGLPQMDKARLAELKKAAVDKTEAILEFFPDKSLVKTTGDKSDKYSWKPKKKNKMIVKNLKTKEKVKVEIFKLNKDTLQLSEQLKTGKLYILYLKVK